MGAVSGETARRACVVLAVLAAILAKGKPALAKRYVVGGKKGWSDSADMGSWASSITFRVGDELVFKYTAQFHNVMELPTEKRYKSCDVSGLPDTMSGGKNTLKLHKPGVRYFACGHPGHCKRGMKVKIKTIGKEEVAPPKHEAPKPHSTPAPAHHHHNHSSAAAPAHDPAPSTTSPSKEKPMSATTASKASHSSSATSRPSKSSSESLMGSGSRGPLVAVAVLLASSVLALVTF